MKHMFILQRGSQLIYIADSDKLMQCYVTSVSFALHQIGQVNDQLNILGHVGLQGPIVLKQANSLSVLAST